MENKPSPIIKPDERFSITKICTPDQASAVLSFVQTLSFESASINTGGSAGEKRESLPHIRNNGRAVIQKDELFSKFSFLQKVESLNFPEIDSSSYSSLANAVKVYKYSVGEKFSEHKDGEDLLDGKLAKLTILIYLNSDFEGGETSFRSEENNPSSSTVKIKKKPGNMLVFRKRIWHSSPPIVSGVKYILRLDALYENK